MRKQAYTDEQLTRELDLLYPKADVPESFQTSWRAAIRREEQIIMEQKKKHNSGIWLRRVLPATAALVLVVGAIVTGQVNPKVRVNRDQAPEKAASYAADTATGSEDVQWSSWDFAAEDSTESEALMTASMNSRAAVENTDLDAGTGAIADGAKTEQKIIRTASLTLKTTNFDQAAQQITALVEAHGGYVENMSISGDSESGASRRASYTLRIPAPKLDAFLGDMSGVARVTEQSETRQDRTAEYQDTATRLKTQQEKMARLQTLIGTATEVTDIIEIESAIADTQYMLDSFQTSLNTIDRKVINSTVTLSLREEKPAELSQVESLSLSERIQSGFKATIEGVGTFFENMLVFLSVTAPVWLGLIVIAVVVTVIVKAKRRKAAPKKEDEIQ